MEKQGEAAAGRRLWGEEGEDGSWEGVVTGSPLGKAKFTVLEKKKKEKTLRAALFVSLREFPFADGAARRLCEVHC